MNDRLEREVSSSIENAHDNIRGYRDHLHGEKAARGRVEYALCILQQPPDAPHIHTRNSTVLHRKHRNLHPLKTDSAHPTKASSPRLALHPTQLTLQHLQRRMKHKPIKHNHGKHAPDHEPTLHNDRQPWPQRNRVARDYAGPADLREEKGERPGY